MKKLWRLFPAFVAVIALMPATGEPVAAAAPPGPNFNGFEQNTNGWFDSGNGHYGHIARQQSDYSNSGGYADGIDSAAGNWHARLSGSPCFLPVNSLNPNQDCAGPNTNWGGYSSTFPTGGYRTQIDIYFDVAWAKANPDVRFDWSSSINTSQSTGSCPDTTAPPCFKRDFVFNVSTKTLPTDPDGFRIQSSTNAFREGANPNFPCPSPSNAPENSCRPPAYITTSGWYTFRHTFRDGGDGYLDVDFDIFALGSQSSIAHWTIDGNYGTDSDSMVDVGGNRYGWFANEEIPDLAIDNSLRTGLCHSHDVDGDVKGNDSGSAHFHSHSQSCEGQDGQGQGDVEESDPGSNTNFKSASITSQTFTADEASQTLTMVGTGTDNGLPVAFTLVAVDNGLAGPGVYTLVLSDGYAVTGTLIDGTLTIN